MSRAQQARDWLAAQDGPRTSAQIKEGIGGDKVKVQWAIGCMLRDGMISRVQMFRPATYVLVRDAMPRADRVAAASAGRQEWIKRTYAGRNEARREREAAKQVIADARKAERKASVDVARRKRDELNRAVSTAKRMMLSTKPAKPIAVMVKVQSVDEWMKNGGMVQRLERGARSESRMFW